MKILVSIAIPIAVITMIWQVTTPPSYYEPAVARIVNDPPAALLKATIGDVISSHVETVANEVPGHDEILPLPGTNKILVSGRDEWIWQVDLESGDASRLVFSPVSPTGARVVPGRSDQIYFCMARLDFHQYNRSPGLYLLDLNTRQFSEIVTRVPITGTMRADGLELPNKSNTPQELVYPTPLKDTPVSGLNDSNSRPLQFCNDLDVTVDGRYIYITEPFSNPRASSGLGAIPDGITLARNGRVWRYDTEQERIGLVLENNVFADGILIEYSADGEVSSLLVSETVNFRIGRANFAGPKAGHYEVLWDNLPGLPDGMSRDEQGRIWVALIKDRSALMTWMHANPWIKPLALRIPATWLPIAKGTALMALSPDASNILAYSHHDGSKILDISVIAPAGDTIYLPSFYKNNQGIHYLPIQAILSGTTP